MAYTIGDLARQTGYAVQTVRYYEQTGLMPEPPRSAGGQRRYTEEHLRRLAFIRHARDLGFEIEDIRSLLDLASEPQQPCVSADAIAQAHLSAIDEKIEGLQALRREISDMLAKCAQRRIADCRVIDALLNAPRRKSSRPARV